MKKLLTVGNLHDTENEKCDSANTNETACGYHSHHCDSSPS